MAQMVNCDRESFGIYRIVKSFRPIYTNRRHYTAILQNFGLHIFFWTAHFFVWTPQFDWTWTPRLNYTMLQNEVELSGLLSKYAEHVFWRRTVLQLCVSASASDGTVIGLTC